MSHVRAVADRPGRAGLGADVERDAQTAGAGPQPVPGQKALRGVPEPKLPPPPLRKEMVGGATACGGRSVCHSCPLVGGQCAWSKETLGPAPGPVCPGRWDVGFLRVSLRSVWRETL